MSLRSLFVALAFTSLYSNASFAGDLKLAVEMSGGRELYSDDFSSGALVGARLTWGAAGPISLRADLLGTVSDFGGAYSQKLAILAFGLEAGGWLGSVFTYAFGSVGGAYVRTEIRNSDLSDDVVTRHNGDLAARVGVGLRFPIVEPLFLGAEASYVYIPDSDFVTIGAVVGITF